MNNTSFFRNLLLLAASAVLLGLAACSSSAPQAKMEEDLYDDSMGEKDGEFDMASLTNDSTLSEMRGGFVGIGGLKINFGLVSSTTINNTLVSSLNLSSNALNGILPGTLHQLLQTGDGNHAAIQESAVPINVLAVIQNTLPNQVIQNQNILNITVSNLAAFRAQQLAFNQRFAAGLSR